jgi:hypothetical protein
VPVNRFFWDCLKDMNSLKDYVTGMSLTFEQANLDFALFYKDAFAQVGDRESARALQKVYDDEISHVAFGLRWFRRWKKTGLSDWQDYVSSLSLPLSPARARSSAHFDVAGRRRAGFDEEFVSKLQVSSFSRGRAPDIYIFDGFQEESVCAGVSFNRSSWGQALERDLSLLPLVFAGEDDILYVPEEIPTEHLQKLKDSGFALPQLIVAPASASLAPLPGRHPGRLKPWAWSPLMERRLSRLKSQQRSPEEGWRQEFRELFSKVWSTGFAAELALAKPGDFLGAESGQSRICSSLEDVKEALESFQAEGFPWVAAKAPYGSSGRNMLRFRAGGFEAGQEGRIGKLIARQGCLIVEPWLERVADFSAHFHREDKLRFLGLSRLLNDERGQYAGSLLGKPFRGLDREVMSFLSRLGRKGLYSYCEEMGQLLEEKLGAFDYRGPLGVDLFVYRDLRGELKLRPVCEVNFRYTMGRLALKLSAKLKPGKCGLLRVASLKSCGDQREKFESLRDGRLTCDDKGFWSAGACTLSPWREDSAFAVLLALGDSVEECQQVLPEFPRGVFS